MKNLPFFILILLPIYLNAQSFWSVVDDDMNHNKSSVTDYDMFQDSLIIVSGYISNASCPHHNLSAYNFKGKKIWNKYGYFDVIFTDSNSIYTAGYTPIDDVMGEEQVVVSKYDKDGNEIYSIGYPEIPHYDWFEFSPVSIDISSDGIILIGSKNSVIRTDIHGTKITEKRSNLQFDINNVVSISPNSYLINTENNFYKTDSTLVTTDSISFGEKIIKAFVRNDTIYSLFEKNVLRLDTSLVIIDTIVSSSSNSFIDIECFGDNIWVQTNYADNINLIKVQNENNDTLSFNLICPINGFVISGNYYAFIGNSLSNQIAVCCFNIEYDSFDIKQPNIDIVDFNLDSIVLRNVIVDLNGDTVVRGYNYYNTVMTLINNGTDTIKTFAVFSDLQGGFNCYQNFFYQKFTDVEILPNQSITVSLYKMYEEVLDTIKICFECLAPNSMIETDINNNFLCKIFSISGITNIYESLFKIYPNPVYNNLNIEFNKAEIKSIVLIDINGKEIYSMNLNDQNTSIDFSNFKSGLYMLKLISDNKYYTRIIIKE